MKNSGSISTWALSQKRLLLILTVLLTIMGLLGLTVIPKSEDPRLPNWWATLVIILPGADPVQIDDQLARPMNDRLKEIEELKTIETTTRSESVVFQIEMKDTVPDPEFVWTKVRNLINEQKIEFPNGTLEPELLTTTVDLENILLAIHGVEDPLLLKQISLDLKDELMQVSGTSRIVLRGDPEEEIQIQLNAKALQNKALTRGQIAGLAKTANTGTPAGALDVGGRRLQIQTASRWKSVDELKELPLPQGSGEPAQLSEVANIQKAPRLQENLARFDGERAVFLGIVPQHPIDIVDFGARVRERIAKFKSQLPNDIRVDEVSFNPDRTQERLQDLGLNLILGVLTVILILAVWMGWRIAIVVGSFVPIISLVGFNFYALTGGILHQISLAAFVISLGQFIDNIIVIVESMQRWIDQGVSRKEAAARVIENFKKPMFFATGTNIAAFLPMLMSTGATAAFTFAIPAVAILTLICAWILALFVVPLVAEMVLRPRLKSANKATATNAKIGLVGSLVTARPYWVIAGTFVFMTASSLGFIAVRKQFFPSADRNQFLVQVDLIEGAAFDETLKSSLRIEEFILAQSEVQSVANFVGEDLPSFYYNVGFIDFGRHTSRLIVSTKDQSSNPDLMRKIQEFAEQNILEARVQAVSLEQGPPIRAPIEYRILSENPQDLETVSDLMLQHLSGLSGVRDTYTELGQGLLAVNMDLDQDFAARFQVSPQTFALDLLTESRGAELSKFYERGRRLDVKLKGSAQDWEELTDSYIGQSTYRSLKASDLSSGRISFLPASIYRYNGRRMVRVLGWLTPAASFTDVESKMQSWKASQSLPTGLDIMVGGESEGAGEANLAIFRSVPLGIFILLICLLLEFNSLRKVSIIFLSVPLVIAGVTPGLLMGNAAFGFMSLLGVLALVGIVVNNSILLIESIDEEWENLGNLKLAIQRALDLRIRPILLTALTTIAGLIPLAFEQSTLWPPLAWAMISGLIGSTLLTLLFVPSLYLIFYGRSTPKTGPQSLEDRLQKSAPRTALANFIGFVMTLAAASSAGALLAPSYSWADSPPATKSYTWSEAFRQIESSSRFESIRSLPQAIKASSDAQFRKAFYPKVGLEIKENLRGKTLTQTNPFGTFEYGKSHSSTAGLELVQPLIHFPEMSAGLEQSRKSFTAAEKNSQWQKLNAVRDLAQSLIQFERLQILESSLLRLQERLKNLESETRRFLAQGLAGQSDALKIDLALSENRIQLQNVRLSKNVVKARIQQDLPDFENLQAGPGPFREAIPETLDRPGHPSDRLDLQAVTAQTEAAELGLQAQKQGYLPSLEARARWVRADQGILDQKDWTEVELVLKWNLFEGGTRQALVQVETARLQGQRAEKALAQSGIRIERQNANLRMMQVLLESSEAQKNFERAQNAAFEDQRNARNGKILVRDWLQSEISLEERRLQLLSVDLNKWQAWIDLKLAMGEPFSP